ncbi:MAG: hypothetical protein ICV60_24055, partial [Pyrinomonadaceae bacterium]|nr:hypothetical protein [Pyrinomonadaceae bacterium]
MPVQHQLLATIKRGGLVLLLMCSLSVVALSSPSDVPVATSVSTTTSGASTFITISGTAPMAYSVSRPNARTILIDLPGVDATNLAQAYTVATPLVERLTVERWQRTNAKPMTRFHVSLRAPVQDRSQLAGNNLVLMLSPDGASGATPVEAKGPHLDATSVNALPSGAAIKVVAASAANSAAGQE